MTEASPTVRYAVSRDGTKIAYWTSGDGPPLVVVHGGAADHTRWRPLLPYLEQHFTVHPLDRRGRGESGDSSNYELAREYEDVAAVVDSVAEASRSPVDLYGHSHGGIVAFGAATLTPNVRKLVLYEGWPVPDPSAYALPAGLEEQLDALLAQGDRDAVVETLIKEFVQLSDEDMKTFKAAPSWPGRVAAAHTVTREIRAETEARLQLEEARRITVPVLLLTGEYSSDPSKAEIAAVVDALPDARVITLAGQEHVADALAPDVFAEYLLVFLTDRA